MATIFAEFIMFVLDDITIKLPALSETAVSGALDVSNLRPALSTAFVASLKGVIIERGIGAPGFSATN